MNLEPRPAKKVHNLPIVAGGRIFITDSTYIDKVPEQIKKGAGGDLSM